MIRGLFGGLLIAAGALIVLVGLLGAACAAMIDPRDAPAAFGLTLLFGGLPLGAGIWLTATAAEERRAARRDAQDARNDPPPPTTTWRDL